MSAAEGARSPSRPSGEPGWDDDEVVTQTSLQLTVSQTSPKGRPLLQVLVGLNAGQLFALDRDETLVGRLSDAQVRIDDVGVSRRHARILRTEGGRYVLEDLGSSNGTLVNGQPVVRVELNEGDRVQIGPTLVLRFGLVAADEEALARQLYEGSTRDGLTHLYNRKYATERLGVEVAYAHRNGTPLGLVMFDLDHFKRINDSLGHPAGDVVLRVVAAQVQRAIRKEDVLARYGGEEFVVLVRGVEPRSVRVLAERVRSSVEQLTIPWEGQVIKVTVSVGVASLSECEAKAPVERLVALADERLYAAKEGGRNRVR